MEDARRREVGLFRYGLIAQAVDPRLPGRERGRLVRELSGREHLRADGTRVRIARSTLDRWVAAYRAGGFDALVPTPRPARPRTDTELLDLAVALKREQPDRTAAQVAELLARARGADVSARTVQRHFVRVGVDRSGTIAVPRGYGRFEAERRNDRWTGDALHGPQVGGAKAYLFAFVDDHSRLLPGYRWGRSEDSLRLEKALRRGLASRGVPSTIYVDNGAAFVSGRLARTCAVLGIRLVHSRPGQPAGRGKIERLFRTVRAQFLVEVAAGPPMTDLDRLNGLFTAWVEQVYHQRVHRETGQTPLARFAAAGVPDVPDPELLAEAFLWAETRTVTKTATVSLHGNRYQTDAALTGRPVELVFDPFDLTEVEVRWNGQSFGTAPPAHIGTHVHPQAAAHLATPDDMPASPGIDYLALVAGEHARATRRTINFAGLPADEPDPAPAAPAAGPEPGGWTEPPLPFPPQTDSDGDGAAVRVGS